MTDHINRKSIFRSKLQRYSSSSGISAHSLPDAGKTHPPKPQPPYDSVLHIQPQTVAKHRQHLKHPIDMPTYSLGHAEKHHSPKHQALSDLPLYNQLHK